MMNSKEYEDWFGIPLNESEPIKEENPIKKSNKEKIIKFLRNEKFKELNNNHELIIINEEENDKKEKYPIRKRPTYSKLQLPPLNDFKFSNRMREPLKMDFINLIENEEENFKDNAQLNMNDLTPKKRKYIKKINLNNNDENMHENHKLKLRKRKKCKLCDEYFFPKYKSKSKSEVKNNYNTFPEHLKIKHNCEEIISNIKYINNKLKIISNLENKNKKLNIEDKYTKQKWFLNYIEEIEQFHEIIKKTAKNNSNKRHNNISDNLRIKEKKYFEDNNNKSNQTLISKKRGRKKKIKINMKMNIKNKK